MAGAPSARSRSLAKLPHPGRFFSAPLSTAASCHDLEALAFAQERFYLDVLARSAGPPTALL